MLDILVCPKCLGSMSEYKDSFFCQSCNLAVPTYVGIPDFRGVNPEFQASDFEKIIRKMLLASFNSSSFRELVNIRFSHSRTPESMAKFQKKFELSHKEKGRNRSFQIRKMISENKIELQDKELLLDIGCGTGTTLPWIMEGFQTGIGIDYSLIDLILGQKYLQEEGVFNIKLVCADARNIPVRNETFSLVNATDVIEHIVPGQTQFLVEVRRVMKIDGMFYFNSPNRFNLISPEPHVRIWFVGFMPRSLMHSYVKKMTGLNYKKYNLLSLNELRTVVSENYGCDYLLKGPIVDFSVPATDFKRKIIKKFPFLLEIFTRLLFFFITGYNVIAFKRQTNK